MTREALNSIVVTVQSNWALSGLNGGWAQEADARLRANMAAPKRGSQGMVKQKVPLLALEDQKAKASSDSESPSSCVAAKAKAMGKKRKRSNSSSSSNQSTTKSALWAERGEPLLAVQAMQEIEEGNERLGRLAHGLAAENDELRRRLGAAPVL